MQERAGCHVSMAVGIFGGRHFAYAGRGIAYGSRDIAYGSRGIAYGYLPFDVFKRQITIGSFAFC